MRILQAVLYCFLWLASAQSQVNLTLEECLALAREHSPLLQTIRNTMQSNGLARDELGAGRLPQLRVTLSPVYAPFGTKFGYDPALSNGGQLLGQVILQQSLYDGGLRSLKSDQLDTDLERLGQEYRLTDRDLTFSVTQSFVQALRSQHEVLLERENVQQLHDYLDLVKRLHNGGTASYTDVLKTSLQLSGAQMSYDQAVDEYAAGRYSLAELIGTAIDTSFSLDGPLETPAPTIDSLLSTSQPDSNRVLPLSIADLSLRSSLLDVQMTQREAWPVVSFSADAGYANSGENLALGPSDRASAIGFSLGLVCDFPLLTWGATDLRVQQKELVAQNLRLESLRLQRSIGAETKTTQLQLLRARERVQRLQRDIASAEENFFLARSAFVGGGGSSLEVLAAQQLLTETRLSELRTRADIRTLTAKLQQLTTR